MITLLASFLFCQANQSNSLTLAGATKFRYPPIMRAARAEGFIDLDITLDNGLITHIKAVQPDPQNARPILRECAEELVRSLNYSDKASGTMRIRVIYKLFSSDHENSSKISINSPKNEITITSSCLTVD